MVQYEKILYSKKNLFYSYIPFCIYIYLFIYLYTIIFIHLEILKNSSRLLDLDEEVMLDWWILSFMYKNEYVYIYIYSFLCIKFVSHQPNIIQN